MFVLYLTFVARTKDDFKKKNVILRVRYRIENETDLLAYNWYMLREKWP